jgi:ribosome-binding factor A
MAPTAEKFKGMSSKRAQQVSEVIRHELNNFIIKELELPKDTLMTITKIESSNDFKYTVVYVSVLPINKAATVLRFLNNNLGQMRHHLTQRLRIYHTPELKFVVDDSLLKVRNVEREIEKLGKSY